MNRKALACIGAAVLLASFWLSGCKKSETVSITSETSATQTVPSLLDVDISKLLTSQEVGSALGVTVGEAQILESGTAAYYTTADAKSSAEISMKECARNVYDSTAALYSDAADTPNLGDMAKWSAKNKHLIVYGKGYMIDIAVDVAGDNSDNLLSSARQIAALVLDRLG